PDYISEKNQSCIDEKSKPAEKAFNLMLTIKSLLKKYQVLNFMLVGGIGYIINMGLYYPLTILFRSETTILGQHFYLPPFFISSFVAISCNYAMNKRWNVNRQR